MWELFSMPEDAYELTVIFFELTNLSATFQTIINKLLRNIIEIGNIAVFINNVMIETEIKEVYNNIIKKVLKVYY